MPQSTGESGNASTASAAPVPCDHRTDPAMKALYHMSRTAGVGLGDYAAVNPLSVVGLLMGVACFLLIIFDNSMGMLVLPVLAIAVCVIAFLQIRGSNGTQVGSKLAIGGVLLAALFAGINVGSHLRAATTHSAYRTELEAVMSRFASAAATQSSTPAAYELFHPRFKGGVSPETFARTLQFRTGLNSANGNQITRYTLGDNILFDPVPETTITQATALLTLGGDRLDDAGRPVEYTIPIYFRKEGDGAWLIYAIPDWFGEQKPAGQQ